VPAGVVIEALFLMFLGQFGSLNALDQSRANSFWSRRLGRRLPSADTLGRVASGVDPDRIRELLRDFYSRQKASKAVPAPVHGLIALVVDGHESMSSDRRCCPGCLERQIDVGGANGEKRTQYYHRYVGGLLVGKDVEIWIDIEPQQAGEDEIAAAKRLVERIHRHLPRAFDVVVGDGLYAQAPFFRTVLALGKDVIAVLKREELLLTREVRELCDQVEGCVLPGETGSDRTWDFEDLTLGEGEGVPVRVVRRIETTTVRRQRTRQTEEVTHEWLWVTTIGMGRLPTGGVVSLGHRRWAIENEGFNQISNRWQLDHVYRHHPVALATLTLLGMLAANLGQTFYDRDLKPALRQRTTLLHVVALIAGGIRLGVECHGASP
jgi:hypothetical protein